MIKKISIILWTTFSISIATLSGMDTEQGNANQIKQLWIACKTGNLSETTRLLDSGINPNTQLRFNEPLETVGDHNSTFLHWAVKGGHSTIAQVLLKKGADKNAQDAYGQTPFSLSVLRLCPEMVHVLLASENNRDDINIHGSICLNLLCEKLMLDAHLQGVSEQDEKKAVAIIELLKMYGAQTTVQDIDGYTPFHFLAQSNRKRLVCALMVKVKTPDDCLLQDNELKRAALAKLRTFLLVNASNDTGLPHLPKDTLFHIFSYMPIECKDAGIEHLVVPHCVHQEDFRIRYLDDCWPEIQKHSHWQPEQTQTLLSTLNRDAQMAYELSTNPEIRRILNPKTGLLKL